jgi:hypothetical protein
MKNQRRWKRNPRAREKRRKKKTWSLRNKRKWYQNQRQSPKDRRSRVGADSL